MKILVADDTKVIQLLVSRFLQSLGHEVYEAADGVEAVEKFKDSNPDMVLMDVVMPRMEGPEAAKLIRQLAGPSRWVPMIYISAIGEESRLASALEEGADDYLVKPLNFRILEAKLRAIQRTLDTQAKVAEQANKLADYYERAEEEKRVARHLMEQMVSAERLVDPQIHYWLSPAESMSGDLIAVARTPGKVLHVMLADGIGHGLTAALNVLPLTQPFYAMTEKGFSMQSILQEMNSKIRQVLPIGRFVAVAFITVDPFNQRLEVWNAGLPDILSFSQDGHLIARFKSRNLPLGILSEADFSVEVEGVSINNAPQVLMYSDGLPEARLSSGEMFGEERIMQSMRLAAPQANPEPLMEAFGQFMGTESHHDDVSMIYIDTHDVLEQLTRSLERAHPKANVLSLALPEPIGKEGWRLQIELSADELRQINAVPFLMSFIAQIQVLQPYQSQCFLILSELYNNALDHGVLKLDSRLKTMEDGMEQFLMERGSRLSQLRDGSVILELAAERHERTYLIKFRVKDSGAGFDHHAYLHREALQGNNRLHGRGILLVQQLCSSLEYLGAGNEVLAYYEPEFQSSAEEGNSRSNFQI